MGQQFVVQLPNRPGELAHLAKALCARGVNIVQVHQTTVGNLTTAEIFTDCCDDDTTDVLRGMGYPFVAGTSLIVEIEDTPCALGELTSQAGPRRGQSQGLLRHGSSQRAGDLGLVRGQGRRGPRDPRPACHARSHRSGL